MYHRQSHYPRAGWSLFSDILYLNFLDIQLLQALLLVKHLNGDYKLSINLSLFADTQRTERRSFRLYDVAGIKYALYQSQGELYVRESVQYVPSVERPGGHRVPVDPRS